MKGFKKHCTQLFFTLLLCGIFSNSYGQFAIGLGSAYGTDIEQFALNLRFYHFPNDKICFGPEFSYFPSITKQINGEQVERQLTEYNITGHYIFEISHIVAVYPLLGLNYSVEKETEHNHRITATAFGVNLGAGVHFSFGRY